MATLSAATTTTSVPFSEAACTVYPASAEIESNLPASLAQSEAEDDAKVHSTATVAVELWPPLFSVTASDGIQLRVALGGRAGGAALLLVAGQGSDHSAWDPVSADFEAAGFRTVRWDHRGTGGSDKPEAPPYSIERFALDGIDILDALSIPRAHVYGVSMGGRVAQRLAIAWPARVGAVVIGCSTPGNAHGVRRPPDVDAQMASQPTDPEEALRFKVATQVTPAFALANPWYIDRKRDHACHPIPAYASKLHYAASEAHDAWAELPTITAPTLVIHGTDDPVNPTANAPLLAGRIPGAELVLVDGGRHAFYHEFREQASAAVISFLNRHSALVERRCC